MAVLRTHLAQGIMGALLAITLSTGASACSGNAPSPSASGNAHDGAGSGTVAIFVPSDGLTISQHTPLSKWAKLVPAITTALEHEGMRSNAISTTTSSSLDTQSHDIQDFVVGAVSGDAGTHQSPSADTSSPTHAPDSPSGSGRSSTSSQSSTAQPTTLVVAPVVPVQATTRQYGDYTSHPLTWSTADTDDASPSDNSADTDTTQQSRQARLSQAQAGRRLVSALNLARESGMHIMVLANPIQGFTPDIFVQMSTARQIGAMQARQMVTKLDLDKVTSRNPKEIEILLPYASDDDDAEGSSDRFAQESFSGLWSVLAPYVKSGRVTSPSGKLERSTSQGDWRRFTFSAQDSDAITDEVDHRLSMSSRSGTHTRVDGIIAMNDFVASGVVKELEALKYTGSSADVNPSISVSGIVNNLVGKRDLNRSSVPKPPRQSTDAGSGNDASEEKVNSRWPIVTGYGAYTDSLPQIVNGKQWMTGTEPRTALANDIAGACTWMNAGNSAASFAPSSTMSIDGVRTRTITQTPVAVSAANLKRELIDTGYVSMADAGL
ncbi:hypothetical protein [Bifidobacterium mongoliense]|uniref:hypothetical protein n=1 Tax=Bifidobacterium mongoliense TaxID=518643 RepID=UPI002653F812|nr:hypothetical protein [Bifidobacterium mongoliense]